jgi:hypothetical protein
MSHASATIWLLRRGCLLRSEEHRASPKIATIWYGPDATSIRVNKLLSSFSNGVVITGG